MTLVNCLDEDIPFGIRALIEDPQVEGVWNARTATALHFGGARSHPPPQLTIEPVRYSSIVSTSTCDAQDIGLASPNGEKYPNRHEFSLTVASPYPLREFHSSC